MISSINSNIIILFKRGAGGIMSTVNSKLDILSTRKKNPKSVGTIKKGLIVSLSSFPYEQKILCPLFVFENFLFPPIFQIEKSPLSMSGTFPEILLASERVRIHRILGQGLCLSGGGFILQDFNKTIALFLVSPSIILRCYCAADNK